ncbi:MAG: AraC family transcriptional regulator ligand-binding domain-containing protein [Pseudomonadota bacterium]
MISSIMASLGIDIAKLEEASRSSRPVLSRVSRDQRLALTGLHRLEAAVELLGDPSLAIRIGQQIDITRLGTFGFALLSSANIRAALGLYIRYQPMMEPGTRWDIIEQDAGLVLRLRQTLGTAYQQQLLAELLFSSLQSAAQLLVTAPTTGLKLQFGHARPAHATAYEERWPVPVEFGHSCSQVFVPLHWANQPVRTANPTTHVVFMQQCEELLRGLGEAENTSATVRRLLIESAGDFLDISKVANRLHLTERTLRRRLTDETTSFRSISDEVRNVLAQRYLADTSLPIAEIANLLDYTEGSNFRRAFVRWNGMTPSAYRGHHRTTH